jgi:phenylalanyl-tRNA synthetase alpha chain
MTAVVTLDAAAVRRCLSLRDLTDPAQGPHALQALIGDVERALADRWADRWDVGIDRRRLNPVVTVADNYDRLGYDAGAAARDARYSRYVTDDLMLRAHTSAGVPVVLDQLAATPPSDVVLSLPGLVYRRDVIDRHHVGEPHQLDLWRIRGRAPALRMDDLYELVELVVGTAVPGGRWQTVPARHPYTLHGREVQVETDGTWVEVGECGLTHPHVLRGAGLGTATGLASGWGLDRLLMLRKGIDDIRLLRSPDPRVAAQMLDLEPYRPVSWMPPITRDLSLAVAEPLDAEAVGDRVRDALGPQAEAVEEVAILSTTPGEALPPAARDRLGLRPGQHNLLVRVVLRAPDRTLTTAEANVLRDRVYAALHEGSVHQWAAR